MMLFILTTFLTLLNLWLKNDPILRLTNTLIKKKILKKNEILKIENEIFDYVENEYNFTAKRKITRNKLIKKYIF